LIIDLKKKNKKKQSTKLIFIIQVFMVFLLSSGLLALYGLQYEKKISNIYEKIDKIDKEKKILQTLKGALSFHYGDGTNSILIANDHYLLEADKDKEINYCIRHWEISRYSTFYEYFFSQYKKFSNQEFYNQTLFKKTQKNYDSFLSWHKKYKRTKPCQNEEHREFVVKTTKDLVDGYYYFITNLDKVLNDLYLSEDILFDEIKKTSNKASNIYITTFLILLLSTTLIILADVRSNRGNDD
tara:strand:+ start:330 stop:1052 length:723 start_codon:yes stop_codon:yes gene_type:complete